MLSINKDAVFISSALFPKPDESLIPSNIGDTILCATIIFLVDSEDKNSYWLWASDNWTGVIVDSCSLFSLKAKINLPLFEDPENLRAIFCSINSLSCWLGTPLLKDINIDGLKPLRMLLRW